MIAGHLLGKRVILNYHSGEADDHLSRWGALVHPWLRLADAIVVPSEYLRAVFLRHGYRASVIPNAIDTARFSYRRRRELRPRLLSVRNLEALYRIDNTLEAFALVRSRHPDATLTVAGYGSQETALHQIARKIGSRGIRFVGRVEPEAMPALFDDADIFVNSSEIDNQPVSILEAFASGVPVVSTATGAIADMVRDGDTGLTIPPSDPPALAKAIVRLLEGGNLAARVTCAARREVEGYTWQRCREQWLALYRGAAS
jgi:glycosyltransferase involved in cell wall biosynthesis